MRITRFAHRIVRLAIVAVAIAASTAVSAQHAATYEVVSSFDIAFFNGRAPSSLRQADDGTFYGTTSFGGVFDQRSAVSNGHDRRRHVAAQLLRPPRRRAAVWPGARIGWAFLWDDHGRRRVRIRNGVQIRSGRCGDDAACVLGDRQQVPCGSVSGERWQRLRADGGRRRFRQRHDLRDRSGRQLHHHSQHSAQCRQGSCPASSRGATAGSTSPLDGGRLRSVFGTIFTIDDAGTATILHSFGGFPNGDGAAPVGLIQARDGRLYGTTRSGGASGGGTVYSIDPTGDYRVLHSFSSTVDGSGPGPDLLEASDGNLYGVTQNIATVFRIDSSGSLTTLQSLTGTSPGELIQGADGRLYGPTAGGGPDGGGTIIRLDLAGTLTTVYQFARGAERWQTEWRDPGTQRPILWDNTGAALRLRDDRDSVRDGCRGRTHDTAHVRDGLSSAHHASSTAHRCRTCSRAPTEACTEPRSTCFERSFSGAGTDLQNQPCRRLHEGICRDYCVASGSDSST